MLPGRFRRQDKPRTSPSLPRRDGLLWGSASTTTESAVCSITQRFEPEQQTLEVFRGSGVVDTETPSRSDWALIQREHEGFLVGIRIAMGVQC